MSQIKPVEASERTLTGLDFFLLWAGAGIALTEIWAGGLIAPVGLPIGLLVILIGHALGTSPLALAGLIGSRHGVPAIVSTRAALGNRGSLLPAVINVIQLVGWTAVMIWIGGQAAARLTPDVSWMSDRHWMLICGLLTTAWAMGGHRWWKPLQRVAVALLLVLSIAMTVLVFQSYSLRDLFNAPAAGGMSMMLALDLVIAMPISWLPLASDYARFAKRSDRALTGTFAGYFVASSWMYAVGLCAALATGSDAPDSMVLDLMAGAGFVLPALVIVFASTFTTTFLDIYSNSVSVLSICPKLNERVISLIGGLLGTGLALVFTPAQYEPFLLFIGASFCPLFGIVLADYFIVHRGRYEAAELFTRGRYWATAGFNVPALVVWAIGFAIFHISTKQGWPTGASLPSMLLAAFLHVAWARLFRKDARD